MWAPFYTDWLLSPIAIVNYSLGIVIIFLAALLVLLSHGPQEPYATSCKNFTSGLYCIFNCPPLGRCDPDDLIVEDDEKKTPVLHPPRIRKPPPPPTSRAAEEDFTPDPNTGIVWENYPPRGDVPYRTQFIRFNGGESADQPFLSQERRQLRLLGNNRSRVRQESSHTSWVLTTSLQLEYFTYSESKVIKEEFSQQIYAYFYYAAQ